MRTQALREALHGLIAAPVTPFHSDYSLDTEAIAANASFLLNRDVRLFVPCGSIGEFASLTLAERKTVLEETIKAVRTRALGAGQHQCNGPGERARAGSARGRRRRGWGDGPRAFLSSAQRRGTGRFLALARRFHSAPVPLLQ